MVWERHHERTGAKTEGDERVLQRGDAIDVGGTALPSEADGANRKVSRTR